MVSVPLVNTSLSPHHGIVGSASGVAVSVAVSMPERSSSLGSAVERMSVISGGKIFSSIIFQNDALLFYSRNINKWQ